MAITSPATRLWWKEPIHRVELIWIIVAFVWGVVMFFMMIYWHGAGEQNLSNEAYKISPEKFAARSQAMIDEYTVREENYFPVVHPPAGSDVSHRTRPVSVSNALNFSSFVAPMKSRPPAVTAGPP